jgi:Ca-activated chloride channel family protein
MGNYKDATMEELANKGNGNYAYIDTLAEAQKVLVDQLTGTLVAIAKDVKIQIEFSPQNVASYRLIGYENRLLRDEDFNDDAIDAGEIGAGHTVTALYEIVAPGVDSPARTIDPLKYQQTTLADTAQGDELLTLKVRYKEPDGETSKLLSTAVRKATDHSVPTINFRFSAAVAAFGMILRGSPHKGNSTLAMVKDMAQGALGEDSHGYRREFLRLVEIAQTLKSMR